MADNVWDILDRKALEAIRLSMALTVAFNVSRENDQRLDGGPLEDVRETLGFKQGFLDEVVQHEDGG